MKLAIEPISLREARSYVTEHHRHNGAPRGWKFGAAITADGETVGVVIVGRPNARNLQDGYTVEVTRLCLREGAPKNAASMGYGAACRAARALGFRRIITYTLMSEEGRSLQAAGFTEVYEQRAGQFWSRPGRPRADDGNPTEAKRRWERVL